MKKDEKKQSVPPLAILAFGLIILAIVGFALLRDRETAQIKSETPAQQALNQNQNSGEPVIPEPAVPMATTQQEPVQEEFRIPAYHETVDNIKLPPVKDPSSVSAEARAAYLVVQAKPKLIAQLPCFCYCERWGHGSLHDCFVTEHAVTCDICMKEALQADQMDRQGVPIAEIRETIVAQFRQRAEDHTGHNH